MLFFFCAVPSSLFPQAVDTGLRDVTVASPVFKGAFIKQNRVRAVSVALSSKPDNQPIVDKGLTESFRFDTTGRLTEYSYTRVKSYGEKEIQVPAVYRRGRRIRPAYVRTEYAYTYDTVFTYLFYDTTGHIIGTRSTDNYYYDTHYYEYDSLGRMTKEVRCKETNTGTGRNDFKLGVQQVLSLETFQYVWLSEKQCQLRSFNDEGRQYKKTILNYDERRNLVDRYEEFVVGWVRSKSSYRYDSLSRLTYQSYLSNAGGDTKESLEYGYDVAGNLLFEKKYKEELLQTNTEYLYDPQGRFLTSRITRNFNECTIGIAKFTYQFY